MQRIPPMRRPGTRTSSASSGRAIRRSPWARGSRSSRASLRRTLAYTYEVRELVPGERLVMRTTEGPFPMETTYTWEDSGSDGTRMTLRNRGEPAGFSRLAAPVLAGAMRRANRKDLRRLKQLLER